jgi:hypothetical protein
MPRIDVPLQAADISHFAKILGRELKLAHEQSHRPPGHVELLNMLARAAGFRNFQGLRVQRPPQPKAPEPAAIDTTGLSDTAVRALRLFDAQGRLQRWPTRFAVQRLMLWGLWLRFDSSRRYDEREVNELLNAWHLFGDHCTLRRELITMQLLTRKPDGSDYRKLPRRPDDEVQAFLRELRRRSR